MMAVWDDTTLLAPGNVFPNLTGPRPAEFGRQVFVVKAADGVWAGSPLALWVFRP